MQTYASCFSRATLGMLACLFGAVARAAESDPIVIDYDINDVEQVIIVGATLGENWSDFPTSPATTQPRVHTTGST